MRRCSSDCGFQPFGGRDDEHAGGDPADAGEHVAQELHVAGNIDEADLLAGGQGRVGEPEVDREPSALLLLEPVGVGAGEGEHERRLAVVDVAGGGDDRHESTVTTRRTAR